MPDSGARGERIGVDLVTIPEIFVTQDDFFFVTGLVEGVYIPPGERFEYEVV